MTCEYHLCHFALNVPHYATPRANELVKKKFKGTMKHTLVTPLSGLAFGWEEKLKHHATAGSTVVLSASASDHDENDSLVQFRGMMDDHKMDTVEHPAISSKTSTLSMGTWGPHQFDVECPIFESFHFSDKYYQTMIKIEAKHVPAPPMTQKQAQGGDKKWKLSHLPVRTADLFRNQLVPLAREKAGTVGPWEAPSVSDLQIIVDHVYGPGVHTVVEDNVWLGLVCFICYCIEYN